jgi:hypothetical protein
MPSTPIRSPTSAECIDHVKSRSARFHMPAVSSVSGGCSQRLINEVNQCTRGVTIRVHQRHGSDNGHDLIAQDRLRRTFGACR